MTTRGCSNKNDTGNNKQRRARKLWLLGTFGDGITVQCVHCAVVLFYSTLTVDRIIPGCRGGRYTKDNIQPSCGPCNSRLGGALRSSLRQVVA